MLTRKIKVSAMFRVKVSHTESKGVSNTKEKKATARLGKEKGWICQASKGTRWKRTGYDISDMFGSEIVWCGRRETY